jgi:tetratricopeptide (TPR) repeat protein
MKINRQPLRELTEEIVRKDHEFWTRYSERLIGNWITYDTSVKDIAAFVEKLYLRRDFSGFKGDRRFIRDDQGQKAFSKLRSSIAGLYTWRINDPDNRDPVVQQRMIKEADFAFRQAFAFCPYSPEAVFQYVNLLISLHRYDDALVIASTCQKLDPYNGQANDVVKRLKENKQGQANLNPQQLTLAQMEQAVRDHPTDFQAGFNLASAYLQVQQPARALEALDRVLNHPQAQANAFRALLQAYTSLSNSSGLERTVANLEALVRGNPTDFSAALGLAEGYRDLQKPEAAIRTLDQVVSHSQVDADTVVQAAQQYAAMTNHQKLAGALDLLTKLKPESPEVWYDLAAVKAVLGKSQEAMPALRRALDLSAQRLKQDPKAHDLQAVARQDSRFDSLRQMPEFKQLTAPR